MRLVSATLAGGGRHDYIADALRSVLDWVDVCLLVDTGPDAAEAIRIGKALGGDKVVVRKFPWNPAAGMRNVALQFGAELGDYVIVLDTDERLLLRGENVRARLEEEPDIGIWMAWNEAGQYPKVRITKVPTDDYYKYAIHEVYVSTRVAKIFDRLRFREITRVGPEAVERCRSLIPGLLKQSQDEPTSGRWHYYLGDSYAAIGELDLALHHFDRCYELADWDQEAGWACFRGAFLEYVRERWGESVRWATKGMAAHSGLAELPWLAGGAAAAAGGYDKAIYFARLAETLGYYKGIGRDVPRFHWRELMGLYEGPYEVLYKVFDRIGDQENYRIALEKFEDAKAERLGS